MIDAEPIQPAELLTLEVDPLGPCRRRRRHWTALDSSEGGSRNPGRFMLQKNTLNRHTWATREELRIAIVTWIERTYHRRRRQPASEG